MKKIPNRTRRFEVRLTETEFSKLQSMESESGVSRTDIIRQHVFRYTAAPVSDRKEILRQLDVIGATIGRIGNNINQLARHANELRLTGKPPTPTIESFLPLFDAYIKSQRETEKLLRQLLRSLGRRDMP